MENNKTFETMMVTMATAVGFVVLIALLGVRGMVYLFLACIVL